VWVLRFGRGNVLRLKSFSSRQTLAVTCTRACRHRQRDTAKGRFRTGVDSRLVSQGVGSSLHERRHEAQLDVVLFQEGVFVSLPHLCDVAARK